MADAAGRYLDWLTKHSRQILETAYVIDILAYVYEETRQGAPPATIANNREEVHRLIASNAVKTPSNAGLDAQYQQYRAQCCHERLSLPPGLS